MNDEPETFDRLCTRLANYIMRDKAMHKICSDALSAARDVLPVGFEDPKDDWQRGFTDAITLVEQELPAALVAAGHPNLMEMRICVVQHVMLRPNQAYIFTIDPNCESCLKAAECYT